MQFEPRDLLEKLEFNKILKITSEECVGELGRMTVLGMLPSTDKPSIENSLNETFEFKLGMEMNDQISIAPYEDISEELKYLAIEGYVLSVAGLQKVNKTLRGFANIYNYFTNERQSTFKVLAKIIRPLAYNSELTSQIDKVIDEFGEIRPDASPALARIRKQIGNKQRELDKSFKSLVLEFRNKGWLTDNVESIRNNRRVLSVPAEHKRKIKGIIHDESSTGQTSFIEPEQIIFLNNDIFDLEMAERQEIYRLLKELSALLNPYTEDLDSYQTLLTRFDVIQAKARLGLRMKANVPKLREKPFFGIWEARHPLLYLKNEELGKPTIPFDLTLLYDNRILLVSGPNAGGKSIFMKAVGLLQLMAQTGFLIPVRGDTQMCIFKKIFVDIGDQQSIEDDLSTYSSRLKNMNRFLELADEQTLILIDEFGSGTDPVSGGVIAEAILKELNEKKVFGIMTTHYSNLKIFAFKNKGIVNAAMYFDRESLTPTYELKIGRPGSSYAFEIAQKTGLPKNVLNYARNRAGKNERAVDQLLIDLQMEKKELENKLETITQKHEDLNRLIKSYEELNRDLEFRRKKVSLEAKKQALDSIAEDNKAIQKAIREIRETQNLEKAKKIAEKAKIEKQQLEEQVNDLKEVVYKPIEKTAKKLIKIGDYVKLRTGTASGIVESISKNKVILKIGDLRMTVPISDLLTSHEPEQQNKETVKVDLKSNAANFERKIDIRGLFVSDAMRVVEEFVDNALIANAHLLQIVHGKGNGKLRSAVKLKLKEYKDIDKIWHPEEDAGGDGITLAEFAPY